MNYSAPLNEGVFLTLDLTSLPREVPIGERVTLKYCVENGQGREIHLVQGRINASFIESDRKCCLRLEKIADGICPCCDPGEFPQFVRINPGESYANEILMQFVVYWPGKWKFVFSAGFVDAEGMKILQDCADSDDRTWALIAEQKILELEAPSLNLALPAR
jgi:hypothetical protein